MIPEKSDDEWNDEMISSIFTNFFFSQAPLSRTDKKNLH